jgi:hypothetical protein
MALNPWGFGSKYSGLRPYHIRGFGLTILGVSTTPKHLKFKYLRGMNNDSRSTNFLPVIFDIKNCIVINNFKKFVAI